MISSFMFSLNATLPVFLMMVVGYFFRKWNIVDEHFANVGNKLVFRVALPAMLFLDLYDTDIRHNFDVRYIGFCFMVTLFCILTIWFLARRFLADKTLVGEFVQCSYRSSAAILGAAFVMNIYGHTGMTPLMIIGSVPLYNIFAVTILVLESEESKSIPLLPRLKKSMISILTNPIILAIVAGLLASLINLPLAPIPKKLFSYCSSIATPLGLIAVGANLDVKRAFGKIKLAAVTSLIKTVLLTGLFLPVALFFGFRDQQLVSLVIMLGSPTTISSYIMAKNLGHEGTLTSTGVILSTLLSSVTLTFWIFLIKYMGWIAV